MTTTAPTSFWINCRKAMPDQPLSASRACASERVRSRPEKDSMNCPGSGFCRKVCRASDWIIARVFLTR